MRYRQPPAGRWAPCGAGCASWRRCVGASAGGACRCCCAREGMQVNHKKLRRLYGEERLQVRRRGGRKRALGTRAPMALPQGANQRWSLDFVSDTLIDGRRFRILAVVDDFTRECLCLVADTSLSGRRVVARARRHHRPARPAAELRLRQRHRADQHGDPALVAGHRVSTGTTSHPASRSRTPSSRASTAGCATSCLNETLFTSLAHARAALAAWRRRLQH